MSHCRICGKPIPSIFRQRHEQVLCLEMRKQRGDPDVLMRELPRVELISERVEIGQKRLFELAKPIYDEAWAYSCSPHSRVG